MSVRAQSRRLILLSALVLAAIGGTAAAQGPASKISGQILYHKQIKESLQEQGVSPSSQEAALLEQGIAPGPLGAEECALYVERPLTQEEKAELAARGITVHQTYVPPVPDKHPYGFYLSTVAYDALDEVQADERIVLLTSTARLDQPMNDLGLALMNVDDVHNGIGVTARDGTGVNIAVADSSLDTTHPDFPVPVEAYDMTDGTGVGTWGTDVSSTVSDHGTHVTGSALGRGTQSGGQYKGAAPGANLYFYKIGNDFTASASIADEVEAIVRAGEVGCDIFTMSYGGVGSFNDGSEEMEQAIDAAVAGLNPGQVKPMVVFMSAGNEANKKHHASVSVAPGATSSTFGLTINNSAGVGTYTTALGIRVVWIDDTPGDFNISLNCTNLTGTEDFLLGTSDSSVRGTESRNYGLFPEIAAGATKSYTFELTNSAGSGSTPLVHLFALTSSGLVTFDSPDESYTIGSPGLADDAIAVGSWTSRKAWTDYKGDGWFYNSLNEGTRSEFSSLGPRVDGLMKPDVMSTGAAIISCRDNDIIPSDTFIIDNDGAGLGVGNTLADAEYCIKTGTSMACPLAAGIAALLLEEAPGATPAQIKAILQNNAANAGSPDSNDGYGLIDALATMQDAAVPVKFRQFIVE
ncbi:MAG TPA: S8 family serine peptidase [Candidatus Sumerlaeota bacterium]|nr:S8 family serine peptidase [Candidatus Sumerlaeota bacterium]